MKKNLLSILTSTLLVSGVAAMAADGTKEVTITERQEILMKKIDKCEKSGELTLKEAEGLRKEANKILDKEVRMKEKNGGKLSYKNISEVEKDLNKLSLNIQKKALAKRVMR